MKYLLSLFIIVTLQAQFLTSEKYQCSTDPAFPSFEFQLMDGGQLGYMGELIIFKIKDGTYVGVTAIGKKFHVGLYEDSLLITIEGLPLIEATCD